MAKAQKPETPATVRVTLKKSPIGRPPDQGLTLTSMGLRKLHQTVELQDNQSIRGMINKVSHLVTVEE
jgi:large subunit ribosomal protein L30